MARFRADALPDFLIIGAPKAGSTALHAALAAHPQLYACPVKEPKYFLSPDRRPDRAGHRGPGDAHSVQEWIWRADEYERLFAGAPRGRLKFESTPFYLWDRASHAAIGATLNPDAKLIAVIRDPVDRAFSNWTHLRADGLEPEPDFLAACLAEPERIARGWAPFWRYLELGRYGEQLQHLYRHVDADRVHVIRYRALVDRPTETLDGVCRFLGVDTGLLDSVPRSNVGRWTAEGRVNDALRGVVVAGAKAGAYVPPQWWRQVERRLLNFMQRGGHSRPKLERDVRTALVPRFAADNALLNELLDADYSDWMGAEGGGTYTSRAGRTADAKMAKSSE